MGKMGSSRTLAAAIALALAGWLSAQSTGEGIVLRLSQTGEARDAEVRLFLPLNVAQKGLEGRWVLAADVLDEETGQITKETPASALSGPAGLGPKSSRRPTLPFLQVYRKTRDPLILYCRTAPGVLDLRWGPQAAKTDNVVVSPEVWLKYSTEMDGGLRIAVPDRSSRDDSEWLEFIVEFEDVRGEVRFKRFAAGSYSRRR